MNRCAFRPCIGTESDHGNYGGALAKDCAPMCTKCKCSECKKTGGTCHDLGCDNHPSNKTLNRRA